MLLLTAVAVFAPQIAALFGLSNALLPMGTIALRLYVLSSVFAGVSVMLCAYCGKQWNEIEIPCCLPSWYIFWWPSPWPWGRSVGSGWPFSAPSAPACSYLDFGSCFGAKGRSPFLCWTSIPICHQLLQGGTDELGTFLAEAEAFCDKQNASLAQIMLVNLAVEEMCQAIFLHVAETSRHTVYIDFFMTHRFRPTTAMRQGICRLFGARASAASC